MSEGHLCQRVSPQVLTRDISHTRGAESYPGGKDHRTTRAPTTPPDTHVSGGPGPEGDPNVHMGTWVDNRGWPSQSESDLVPGSPPFPGVEVLPRVTRKVGAGLSHG